MLASMLSASQRYTATPESQFKLELLHHPIFRHSGNGRSSQKSWQLAVDWLKQQRRFRHWETTLALPEPDTPFGIENFLEHTVQAYAHQHCPQQSVCAWVDHTPHNLRHAFHFAQWFPNVHFIHIIRDGRAVAASQLPLSWGTNNILTAANNWSKTVGIGLAAELAMPQRVSRVRFEDLVAQPEIQLRRLCNESGLKYESAMTQGGGFQAPVYTRNQHRLVKDAPLSSRAEGWKAKLSPRQIELFESQTADLLPLLGYVKEYGLHARGPKKSEKWWLSLQATAKRRFRDSWIKNFRNLK